MTLAEGYASGGYNDINGGNMPVKFTRKINCCSECQFMRPGHHYWLKQSKIVFDWTCTQSNDAIVATLAWGDPKPEIPAWCPLQQADKPFDTDATTNIGANDASLVEIERLRALVSRLRLEAQVHAQEARTANATIAEIYQCVTGSTGEPGNWNGAKPVVGMITRLRAQLAEAMMAANRFFELGWFSCTNWADRPDLLADIGSPAYRKERDAMIANEICPAGGVPEDEVEQRR